MLSHDPALHEREARAYTPLCKTTQIFLSLFLKSSYSVFAQRFPDDN
jgi:hypothetical protein